MKKILTAIGNPMLNNKIKNKKDCEVLTGDLKTDEEVIEWIERAGEIDILFLSSYIIHNYKVDELLKIIRKIQEDILIIFFKKENIECNAKEDNKLKIYNALDLDWSVVEQIFEDQNKKAISQNKSKIIAISGASGVGKSTFSTILAKTVENAKALLIDFDLDEAQIKTILKIKKQPKYEDNIKNVIISINKNLDVLCHFEYIFSDKSLIDILKIQEVLNQLKDEYDLIIIDTSSKLENEYTKRIFYNTDKIIFLLEPNILGVKKSKNMLEVFENDWKISNEKVKLVLNKTNIYQISDAIIQELFPNLELLGKMKYMDSYNLMINKSVDKKEIKKECGKIYKKIEQMK